VLGANTVDSSSGDVFNSALLLDQHGNAVGRYDKVRLLAFGEYIPGIDIFPWLAKLLRSAPADSRQAQDPASCHCRRLRPDLAPRPLICYEDLLPDFVRSVGELHPDLLVNLTSDQCSAPH